MEQVPLSVHVSLCSDSSRDSKTSELIATSEDGRR